MRCNECSQTNLTYYKDIGGKTVYYLCDYSFNEDGGIMCCPCPCHKETENVDVKQ